MGAFAFEVEFLTGVSVAATPNRRDEAEWPPHPDRLFQALVAAWGRNDPPDAAEGLALEWLERLDPATLSISAPPAHQRDVVRVYVPPNDLRTTGRPGDKIPRDLSTALAVIPALRMNRQPRFFPAVVPIGEPPVVRYRWQLSEQAWAEFSVHRPALERLAREVVYLGHSHSLVRVALVEVRESTDRAEPGTTPLTVRMPHPGRLQHLREQYRRSMAENRAVRPQPSLVVRRYAPAAGGALPGSWFEGENAIVLAGAGGFVPGLAAFPAVAKRLRDALLVHAQSAGFIPPLLSGHDAEGRPLQRPHMAIVPLADVGWDYSEGRLLGLALVWPTEAGSAERRAVIGAVASFLKQGDGWTGHLHFGRYGSWLLVLEPEPDRASLRFFRYVGPARRWGTVLPAVLDRYPKEKQGQQLADIVRQSCLNIGLPPEAVEGLQVEAWPYAPVKGAPSVREVWAALPQDSPYRRKPLAHLVVSFPEPVRGPLLLGAGRYRGLGLLLPLDREGAS